MKKLNLFLAFSWTSLLVSCAPTVNIGTPDPVKIDVNMRADIYSHDDKDKAKTSAAAESITPTQQRFNRRAQIQDLKNSRIIGEGNDGLLSIRETPSDPKYLEYVKKTVDDENADRTEEFKKKSEELKKPLDVYIKDFAANAAKSAYPGEWIQKEDGTWVKR